MAGPPAAHPHRGAAFRTVQALALANAGEDNAAVDALAGTLTLACPQGYVRVFADEGALLGRLIAAHRAEQAAAHGVPLDYLARLLRAFGGQDAVAGSRRDAAAAVPGLAEQLTARELEILVLLAAGTPNPRIAAELVVSLDTVKKTSATCWASSARPTAARPSPAPASSA